MCRPRINEKRVSRDLRVVRARDKGKQKEGRVQGIGALRQMTRGNEAVEVGSCVIASVFTKD